MTHEDLPVHFLICYNGLLLLPTLGQTLLTCDTHHHESSSQSHKDSTSIPLHVSRVHAQPLSHVQIFASPGTVAHQAPLSKEFSRQEYWGGLPCPLPGDLPNPGIKLHLPISCIGRWILYHQTTWKSPHSITQMTKLSLRKIKGLAHVGTAVICL